MKLNKLRVLVFLCCLLFCFYSEAQKNKQDDYLLRVSKADSLESFGYRDKNGKMVIAFDKYPMIYTDTFRNHAIVLKPGEGFVAIDRKERVLYQVRPFDNGPDYTSEGLYRILKDGKIGYADTTGKIVITPQFRCAFSFEQGKAKVSNECTTHKAGEHSYWKSEAWFYINTRGEKL